MHQIFAEIPQGRLLSAISWQMALDGVLQLRQLRLVRPQIMCAVALLSQLVAGGQKPHPPDGPRYRTADKRPEFLSVPTREGQNVWDSDQLLPKG